MERRMGDEKGILWKENKSDERRKSKGVHSLVGNMEGAEVGFAEGAAEGNALGLRLGDIEGEVEGI